RSANHACSGSSATAARSTRGRSSTDTCGVPSTCHSQAGYWNGSRELVEAAAVPKAGQLFLQVEHGQFFCEPAVRALRGRQAREQRAGLPSSEDLRGSDDEGTP